VQGTGIERELEIYVREHGQIDTQQELESPQLPINKTTNEDVRQPKANQLFRVYR
jgi:hypothetical protein